MKSVTGDKVLHHIENPEEQRRKLVLQLFVMSGLIHKDTHHVIPGNSRVLSPNNRTRVFGATLVGSKLP
jgi:hypothetical protein